MKKTSVGEIKTHFSNGIEQVKTEERIAITFDIPKTTAKRKLGILDGKAKAVFATDFKITEDQFLEI